MGKIFYLMGKSSSGKDTIYKELLQGFPKMKRIVLYTTRPRREGECDGVEYFFTDAEKFQPFRHQGQLIDIVRAPVLNPVTTQARIPSSA